MITIVLFSFGTAFTQESELSLFNSTGKATAYIDFADERTIYLWSGDPVAYLERDSQGGYHVYGFNGEHLGWFVGGILRDHDGKAACATKDAMSRTDFEPFKSFKKFKPFRSFQEFAPFRPFFSDGWSELSCQYHLSQGKN